MRVVTASTNTVTRPQRAAAVPARQLRRCTTQHQLLATATRLDESQPWSFAVAEDSTFRENASKHSSSLPSRRSALVAAAAVAVTLTKPRPSAAAADAATRSGRDGADFVVSPSGLEYLDVRAGEGATPAAGDRVTVHWAGYTKGYQGKRIDNTSVRDEPYSFTLGAGEAIPAFEEAVASMRVGGIRRVEVPGDHPELGYPRDRAVRFVKAELLGGGGGGGAEGGPFKYRYGPQPAELGGERALDFVLDNPTLQDFNRTLLFDIKLLSVRRPS